MIAALGLGAVIGILLGLLGGGGSILAVPALVYGVGLPLRAAVPTSLLVVGISSATAVLPRLRAGRCAAHRRRLRRRRRGVGVRRRRGQPAARPRDRADRVRGHDGRRRDADAAPAGRRRRGLRPARRRGELARLSAQVRGAGVAVGFLTGLFGVGGGFLIIPALVLLLGLSMTVAVGTSLVIIVINSAAGFVAHAGDTTIDYRIAAGFTAAAIVGSLVAAASPPGCPPTGCAAGSPTSSSSSRRSW